MDEYTVVKKNEDLAIGNDMERYLDYLVNKKVISLVYIGKRNIRHLKKKVK